MASKSEPSGTHYNFQTYKGSYDARIESAEDDIQIAVLTYPNNTSVTMRGDAAIITQLVSALEGVLISYQPIEESNDGSDR